MESTRKQKNNISSKTRVLVSSALFAALVCITTAFHIPVGNGGYAHIGDAVIYLSASILPLPYAIACSAIGAGLADLTTGAIIWVVPTLIIKPILVLCFSNKSDKIITVRNVVGAFFAGIICCVLYMFVEGLYFGNIMAAFTITAVGMIQPIGSFIAFIILGLVLDKINFKKFYSA